MWHTWTIWNALRRRPHHPLYQQNLRSAPFSATLLLIALALAIGSAALLLPTLFSALILLLIGGVYLLGVYQGTVAGLLWSLQIAEHSSRARADGRFALYAAAPAGGMSAAWSLAIACLNQENALENRRGLNAECYIVAIFLAVFLGARPLPAFTENDFVFLNAAQTQLLLTLCYFVSTIILFYCNHVGAILFGFLLGLLLPALIRSREDVRYGTVLSYFALQIGTTLLTLIVSLAIWPLLSASPLGKVTALCVSATSSVLLFYLIREWAIQRLFRAVLHQLGSDSVEWRLWLYANSDPLP